MFVQCVTCSNDRCMFACALGKSSCCIAAKKPTCFQQVCPCLGLSAHSCMHMRLASVLCCCHFLKHTCLSNASKLAGQVQASILHHVQQLYSLLCECCICQQYSIRNHPKTLHPSAVMMSASRLAAYKHVGILDQDRCGPYTSQVALTVVIL